MEAAGAAIGALGILLAVAMVIITVVWLIFPFVVMDRLKKMSKYIEAIADKMGATSGGEITCSYCKAVLEFTGAERMKGFCNCPECKARVKIT